MKKNIFVLFSVFFLLVSCEKIEPIKKIEDKKNDKKEELIIENKNSLSEVKEDGTDLNKRPDFTLEEEELIIKRFDLLSQKYDNHSNLVESIQYEKFVEYVYEVFEKYKKIGDKLSEDKNNYIFKNLIPSIVINNYVVNGNISDLEAELIIQSIKRKDFNTLEDKNRTTEMFKIYFEENKFNPFIKKLDFKNLSKEEKLEKILGNNSGIMYSILSNRYNWNKTGIGYKPSDMEAEFMVYLNNKMGNIFKVIGVNEKEVEEYAYKKYGVKSLEELAKSILGDFNKLTSDYNLEGKIPLKRYYRNDERKDIFVDRETVNLYINKLSDGNPEKFINDLEKMRFKMYLLSYFGRDREDLDEDQGLWSSRTRSDFIDKVYGKGVQNLFRLGRYLPGEEVKIDLYEKVKF